MSIIEHLMECGLIWIEKSKYVNSMEVRCWQFVSISLPSYLSDYLFRLGNLSQIFFMAASGIFMWN